MQGKAKDASFGWYVVSCLILSQCDNDVSVITNQIQYVIYRHLWCLRQCLRQ